MERSSQRSQLALTSELGYAVAATILLSDWEKYGLSERIAYHFHLTEALALSDREREPSPSTATPCGVVQLLECIPTRPLQKLSRLQKRSLRNSIKSFNQTAEARSRIHEPAFLPLRLNPSTRVYFAYESTRLALVLDASPSMVSTFGHSDDCHTCPLDKVGKMARVLFQALVEVIPSNTKNAWQPDLSVTVMAVYPEGDPSLLVRDYRVRTTTQAQELAHRLQSWACQTVEAEISRRSAHQSRLVDLINAGHAALSILSSAARPIVVVATDGRAIACESTLEIVAKIDDIPVSILDLRAIEQKNSNVGGLDFDEGPLFPLHLSDDSEGLYRAVKATGGSYFDSQLLERAASTRAGQVEPASTLALDYSLAFKRHSIRPNAVQWYLLFVSSPLSPIFGKMGRLNPPNYLMPRGRTDSNSNSPYEPSRITASTPQESSVFATYVINPIRILGLLTMRIKEGYRTQQYGNSTNDHDKVGILLTLPLDMGIVVYYEVSYKADAQNHLVGVAHIKIELSGDPSFLQVVKANFLQASSLSAPAGISQYSEMLCDFLRRTRKEDMIHSFLAPNTWKDQMKTSETPFIRRLATLSEVQRRLHFKLFEFDCVFVGDMPYSHDDNDFLSDFRDVDSGEGELKNFLIEWATQIITEDTRFLKIIKTGDNLASYCVVELSSSSCVSRVTTVSMYTFGTSNARERLSELAALKEAISALRDVRVLDPQLAKYLVDVVPHRKSERFLKCQHKRASWELEKDPELLPLLMKRRTEIGGFHLLESHDEYALFAKLSMGDLVQYQLEVLPEKVVVVIHMESESGEFFADIDLNETSRFLRLIKSLKMKDQDCGRALKYRTNLLCSLDDDLLETIWYDKTESQAVFIKGLLAYASKTVATLRFFVNRYGPANSILESFTESLLLSGAFRSRIGRILVNSSVPIGDVSDGIWFIVEFDRHTISLVHFSAVNKKVVESDHPSEVREISFFTVSVSDLYSQRVDIVEDGNIEDDHVSEYLCVSDLIDNLINAHKCSYALAAYIALESLPPDQLCSFGHSDFLSITENLHFVETSKVVVGGENKRSSSKLVELLTTVLGECPDDHKCFFYRGTFHYGSMFEGMEKLSDLSLSSMHESDGFDSKDDLTFDDLETHDSSQQVPDSLRPQNHDEQGTEVFGVSPLFVRLSIDGVEASLSDLAALTVSAVITVNISVFSVTADPIIPHSHASIGRDLTRLLDAYVAEQTLQRLLATSANIGDEDLRLARQCLRKARYVAAWNQEVLFYSGRSDDLIPASATTAMDSSLDDLLQMLVNELSAHPFSNFRMFAPGQLFSLETERDSGYLSFWCFIAVKSTNISVEILHPGGQSLTESTMRRVRQIVDQSLFRVNQRLLLLRLHENRTASKLLVAPDDQSATPAVQLSRRNAKYPEGMFECETVHSSRLVLFHRCATNPEQIARNLEATVLHIFAVSNRRKVFVYKHESGSIFYMQLLHFGGGQDADGELELRIQGVDKLPSSVPEQLTRMLKKRLMTIATEQLSSVLSQNPSYSWKSEDIEYVWSFREQWMSLEPHYDSSKAQVRLYAIPEGVSDLGMVLLYFRQNICGSSHFYSLKTSSWPPLAEANTCNDTLDFVFYYNDTPSKLDPKFQALSTLTPKGLEFSRKIGSGIAVIEVTLLRGNGELVRDLNVGGSFESTPLFGQVSEDSSIRCTPVASAGEIPETKFLYRVKITGTNMNIEFLHDWVLLTLNQVISAWMIENCLRTRSHISTSQLGLKIDNPTVNEGQLENYLPGFMQLTRLLNSCLELPHPGVSEWEKLGGIRSAAVSKLTFEMVEKTIIDQLRKDTSMTEFAEDLRIVRLTRGQRPCVISFTSDHVGVINISDCVGGNVIQDTAVDSPEYYCIYCSPEWGPKSIAFPKLFKETMVNADLDERSKIDAALVKLKEERAEIFRRSFAFVLSVKRDRRHLLTYNWSPKFLKSVMQRLQEKEAGFLAATKVSTATLSTRSMGTLSPQSTLSATERVSVHRKIVSKRSFSGRPSNSEASQTNSTHDGSSVDNTVGTRRTTRRAIRPASIQRPNLIGRSIDGSAAHAAAASRERAKSSQFRGVIRRTQSKDGSSSKSSRKVIPKNSETKTRSLIPRKEEAINTTLSGPPVPYHSVGFSVNEPQNRMAALLSKRLLNLVGENIPLEAVSPIEIPLIDYLIRQACPVWSEAMDLPLEFRNNDNLRRDFEGMTGRTITTWHNDLRLLDANSQRLRYFMGPVRCVRGCRCFLVVRLSMDVSWRTEGWLVRRPRQSKRRRRIQSLRSFRHMHLDEKDAMGMRMVGTALRRIPLRGLIWDLQGLWLETSANLQASSQHSAQQAILQASSKVWKLSDQVKFPQLRYHAFAATIVLKSYRNPLINLFTAEQLLQWLQEQNSVRFPPIVVHGTTSWGFIDRHTRQDSLFLYILCRNNGVCVWDFMFRRGSTVALSVADVISIEAAGLALEALQQASKTLRRDTLWKKGISMTTNEIHELMSYCSTTLMSVPCEFEWNDLDWSVLPWQSVSLENDAYFVDLENVFLYVREDQLVIVEKELSGVHQQRAQQLWVNWILQMTWQSLLEQGTS